MSPASNHNITALLSILKPSIADNLAADINQRIRSKASAEQFINNLSATIIPILWQQGVQYIQGHYINKPSFTMDYDFSEGP
jgi:hypothetical protein